MIERHGGLFCERKQYLLIDPWNCFDRHRNEQGMRQESFISSAKLTKSPDLAYFVFGKVSPKNVHCAI